MEMLRDGFEAIITSAGASEAIASGAEVELEVIAKDENIGRWDFVKMGESLDGLAGIIIKSLRFEEDLVAVFEPESVHFGLLPVEMVDFGIKIKRQKPEIMASEIIFWAGITEADDEFHEDIIA